MLRFRNEKFIVNEVEKSDVNEVGGKVLNDKEDLNDVQSFT